MKEDQKYKVTPKTKKYTLRCLAFFGIFAVFALVIHYGQVKFLNPELRLVMET